MYEYVIDRDFPVKFHPSKLRELLASHVPGITLVSEHNEDGSLDKLIIYSPIELSDTQKQQLKTAIKNHSPDKSAEEEQGERDAAAIEVTPEKLIKALKNIRDRLNIIEAQLGI